MQKHNFLLHSSFSLSPFKVSLCVLIHETFESEVLPSEMQQQIYQYIIDQLELNDEPVSDSLILKFNHF